MLYIEPTAIGPLKISQIWKVAVVCCLLIFIAGKKLPGFVWIGIFYSVKYLFYIYFPYGYLLALQDFFESLIFPLFLAYFYLKYKNRSDSSERLMHLAILLSLFLIYSAVPFLFGLKSLNPVTELERYGLEAIAMKGLFYHVAVSSKLFTVATIVLIITWKRFCNSYFNRTVWLSAVLLGSYFVYSSWTRTAWFIFIIALVISLFYGANIKKKLLAAIVCILIFVGLTWLYETNQALRWRLTGGTVYRTDTDLTLENLLQARLPFIIVALENLRNEGMGGQLIGYGTLRGMDLFENKTNMKIISHNKTTEILESSGLIGLFFYLFFWFKLFKMVFKRFKYVSYELKKLTLVSAALFSGFYLTSHGTPFFGEIIFACFLIGVIIEGQRISSKILGTATYCSHPKALY
ncbi:MAG: hypothetical protein SCI25_15040 [Desulfuromonadales bacterium]|nr:hypothetical protein [Desulfuromonadales bacterium]